MPSPFPGMDPYLEGVIWGSFHTNMISQMTRELVPLLGDKYYVESTERFVTLSADDSDGPSTGKASPKRTNYPDVAIVRGGEGAVSAGVATAPPPLRMATIIDEQVPQSAIEIRERSNRELVTAIELLSPANKRGDGRKEYLERRRRFISTGVHLLEIDLLREGTRIPMEGVLPSTPYFIFLVRREKAPMAEVWPIALAQPLPSIPVPLLPNDPDVTLNLQQAFTRVYDECGVGKIPNYANPPSVALSPEDQTWADECLRKAGKLGSK